MGFLDRICWAVLGFGAGLYVGWYQYAQKTQNYAFVNKGEQVFLLERTTGFHREIHSGLVVGSLDERIEDIFRTSPEDYAKLWNAIEQNSRKYGVK